MGIQILNSNPQVNPKAGRLATSSYSEWGAKRIIGSSGALGNTPTAPVFAVIPFGKPSRAGISTTPTAGRLKNNGPNPFGGIHNISTKPILPVIVKHGQGAKAYSPTSVPLIMPHERPVIGANDRKNLTKRSPYRTNMGASKTFGPPSDTAFHKQPVKTQPKQKAKSAREAVKVPRAAQPSFRSNSNLWMDPNNSFSNGAVSTSTGRTGAGRWQITKRGAAG